MFTLDAQLRPLQVYGSEVPLLSGFDVRMLRDAVARTAGDLAAEVMPDHAELQQVRFAQACM